MRLTFIKLLLAFPLILVVLAAVSACDGFNEYDSKPTLTAPQIAISESDVNWESIEHAACYEVYENSTLVKTVEETSYHIVQTAKGTYKYKVKALSADENYSSSKFSNEVVYVVTNDKLATPKISISNGVVSWEAVEHAGGYQVYEGGELVSQQSTTSYTVPHTETGVYKYTVKAISISGEYLASDLSNEVTHIVSERLAAPHISIAGKVISWQAVAHAETYVIYENGVVLYQAYTRTSYEIEQTRVGDYTYYVVARSSNPAYSMSENSNSVNYTIEPTVLATPDGLSEERDEQGHIMLVWNEVAGAGGYNIYENGRIIAKRWTNTSYNIDRVDTGTYEYRVRAVPALGDKQYLQSEESDPIKIEIEDNRTPLSVPTGVEVRYDVEVDPTDTPGDEFKTDILCWNEVENAESYLVYESNKRVYSTTGTQYIIGTVYTNPHQYVFQVKAVAHGTLYKSSELSVSAEYNVPVKEDQEFTITLNKPTNFPAQNITVELYNIQSDGLPAATPISGAKVTVGATQNSGVITYSNAERYVAKITSGLPDGYYASTVRLSAAVTEGTINIYNKNAYSSHLFNLGSNSVRVSFGSDQTGLFIAPEKSLYVISTTQSKKMLITANGMQVIDTAGGPTICTFAADANEAVQIVVNGQEAGDNNDYVFTIQKNAVNQELKIGTGYGDNSNVIVGNVDSATYLLNLDADTEFVFFFSTMYLGPTRFATVTIEGQVYEFDGGYEYKKNIFIHAGQNIEIKVEITGSTTDELMSSVYFSVYPLTED